MILRYDGARGTTWGYRFLRQGALYKRRGFPSKLLAQDAEALARRELDGTAAPRVILTPWTEAVAR